MNTEQAVALQRKGFDAAVAEYRNARGRPGHLIAATRKYPYAEYRDGAMWYAPSLAEDFGYGEQDQFAALADVYLCAAERARGEA
jgi:hypothetical protein